MCAMLGISKKQENKMKTIKISYQELYETIRRGDNCNGNYALVISPNGDYSIVWSENSRYWNNWKDEDVVVPIPSLIPEGNGDFYLDIQETYEFDNPTLEEVKEMVEDRQFCNVAEWIEINNPEWYQEFIDTSLDFLVNEFIYDLNNDTDSLFGEQTISGLSPNKVFKFELA
jgi:hypothetical protein